MKPASSHDNIKKNSGHHLSTTRETLVQRCPESMLAAMFSGRHPQQLDSNGCVFIDRDGIRFRHILNFLRTGTQNNLSTNISMFIKT